MQWNGVFSGLGDEEIGNWTGVEKGMGIAIRWCKVGFGYVNKY